MSGTGAGPARRWRLVRASSIAIPASVRRFNERRRARRIRSARPWVIAGGVLALAGIVSWIVYGSSVLGVGHVRVVGSGFVGDAAVRSAAAVPGGTPLASVDLDTVAKRVERIAGVRSAVVHRAWPSTLVIDVTPRVGVAAVPAGRLYRIVDETGVVFQTAANTSDLPVVVLAKPGPSDPSTRAALTVLHSLPSSIRDQLVRITAASPAQITLILGHGRSVIWGDSSDNQTKGRVAVSLLARPGTVIDVSSPTVVTVR
jgi:cell division protein FtsQ